MSENVLLSICLATYSPRPGRGVVAAKSSDFAAVAVVVVAAGVG